jgi:hypothetical protein
VVRFFTTFLFAFLFSVIGYGQELLLNGNFESAAAKWKSYCDAAGVTPVDGVGGGVAGFAISSSTISPLAGKSSGIITKDAANRQGCGVATDFTVSEENKAQVLQVKIPYKVTSGTYSDDQYKVYVYDIDNASMIEVAPTFIKNSSIKETYRGVFQTSLTGVNYRLIIHNASTSAVASTVKIEASVSSQVTATGSFATDWNTFTCSGSWVTNTTYSCRKREVGDQVEVDAVITTSGAPTATSFLLNLPIALDTNKLAVQSRVSSASVIDGSTGYDGWVYFSSSTQIGVYVLNAGGTFGSSTALVSESNIFTFGAGDSIRINFKYPAVGKTSNTVLSSEYESRPIAFRARKSSQSGLTAGASNTVTFSSSDVSFDDVGAWNGTDTYIVKTPSKYRISASAAGNTTGAATQYIQVLYRINGGSDVPLHASVNGNGANPFASGDDLVNLKSGDTVQMRTLPSVDTTINIPTFKIERVGSSAVQVAASETVGARYRTGAGQSIANASTPIIDFGTKDFDDLGSVTTGGSWKFQPNNPGKYEFCVRVRYANGQVWTATSSYAAAYLYKNGGSYSALGEIFFPATSTPSNSGPTLMGCDVVRMISTDYVEIRTAHNESSARTLLNSDSHNWITIKKVGNY